MILFLICMTGTSQYLLQLQFFLGNIASHKAPQLIVSIETPLAASLHRQKRRPDHERRAPNILGSKRNIS